MGSIVVISHLRALLFAFLFKCSFKIESDISAIALFIYEWKVFRKKNLETITISEANWWVWEGKFWVCCLLHCLIVSSHQLVHLAFVTAEAEELTIQKEERRQKEGGFGSGSEPGLRQFRGSLVDSLGALVSLWKWSCSRADVHRNLPYSPGVLIWRVTGCMEQWGQWGSKLKVPLWSLFVRLLQSMGELGSRHFSISLASPTCRCLCVTSLDSNFSSIQKLTSPGTEAAVCIFCVSSLQLWHKRKKK